MPAMNANPAETCNSCYYYVKDDPAFDEGTCHAVAPPPVTSTISPEHGGTTLFVIWPKVDDDEYCGSWKTAYVAP
jgi:hypothetical protein